MHLSKINTVFLKLIMLKLSKEKNERSIKKAMEGFLCLM